jgi:hypothetical protein
MHGNDVQQDRPNPGIGHSGPSFDPAAGTEKQGNCQHASEEPAAKLLPGFIQLSSFIYKEATDVYPKSPRAAAALLRLCVELLTTELHATGGNLNERIGSLVRRGLQPEVQQALDVVRVVGNSAVDPGETSLDDQGGTAIALFRLVNMIVERLITGPAMFRNCLRIYPKWQTQE